VLFAYIDPGLGALAWQVAVSALVGVLFCFKKTRRTIVGVFRWIFRRGRKPQNATAEIPPTETKIEVHAK
jgi:hypothetical protein